MTERPTRRARSRAAAVVLAVVLLGVAACSSSDDTSAPTTVDRAAITDPTRQVDVSTVALRSLPEGGGVPQRSATATGTRYALPADYTETEYLVEGEANVYAGPATGPVTVESSDHPFVTRMMVRAPSDPAEFSGRVWLEPMNTSGGADLDAIWGSTGPLMAEEGDAWVGVTVRARQTELLKQYDPVRYADFSLTDNDHGWDILRDVATLVKLNPEQSPLADYPVERLYVGGYSQSAVDGATFVSAFHPITRLGDGSPVVDGYLLGSRESNMSPLQSGDSIIPKFEAAALPPVDVPVVNLESQADVEGFSQDVPVEIARANDVAGADEATGSTVPYVSVGGANVRRPNVSEPDDHFWLFEIAGAPHAAGQREGCAGSSTFPTHMFTRAAAAFLVRWTEEGTLPPEADPIELAVLDEVSVPENDEYGNALGGVRSPFLDVPLSAYGPKAGGGGMCVLAGDEQPLDAAVVVSRYGDVGSYMEQFTESLDATIEEGFLLELDRQAILEAAEQKAEERFAGV